ncbi:hypothetical protein ACLOJK_041230 [Asimina triloba]
MHRAAAMAATGEDAAITAQAAVVCHNCLQATPLRLHHLLPSPSRRQFQNDVCFINGKPASPSAQSRLLIVLSTVPINACCRPLARSPSTRRLHHRPHNTYIAAVFISIAGKA